MSEEKEKLENEENDKILIKFPNGEEVKTDLLFGAAVNSEEPSMHTIAMHSSSPISMQDLLAAQQNLAEAHKELSEVMSGSFAEEFLEKTGDVDEE